MTAPTFDGAPCTRPGAWRTFESTFMADHIEAKELCDTACPRRAECGANLERVLTATAGVIKQGGGPVGTWCGRLYTKSGRIASCGTESGYSRHLRDKEPPCEVCKGAKAKAGRERTAR